MKRQDFIKIIRLRSFWKIDKRTGNYKLPSGKRLSEYVADLVETQMKIDDLGISKNGNLCWCFYNEKAENFTLMPAFQDNEICSLDDMDKRINKLVCEIVGC